MNSELFPYNPACETLTPAEIEALQNDLLRKQLAYCRDHSPFYRERLEGMDFTDFTVRDLAGLPLTGKDDFSADTDAFRCVPMTEIGEIVFTSGTTGKPNRIMYSQNDLQRLRYNEQRCFTAAGVNASDVVLLTCTSDRCFIAGLAYYLGARSVGAACIRNGLTTLESHLQVLEMLRPTVLVGVPSFLRHLGTAAKEHGLTGSVRKLICIGEPVRDTEFNLSGLGGQICELWGADVHSTYASSEIVTSFCECEARHGGHLLPDLVVAEIIGDDGNVLPYGETGELVLTQLQSTGMPLIRFRTGDISFMTGERCSCGRFTPRLGPILSRKSHLLKCKGTSLYPQVIFSALDTAQEVADYYIEVSGENLSDRVDAFVALRNPNADLNLLEKHLQTACRMHIPLHVTTAEHVRERVFGKSRKPMRFHDLRGRKRE